MLIQDQAANNEANNEAGDSSNCDHHGQDWLVCIPISGRSVVISVAYIIETQAEMLGANLGEILVVRQVGTMATRHI
jgi:hypothetical protein